MRIRRNPYVVALFGVVVALSALACSSATPAPAAPSSAPTAQAPASISTVAPAPIPSAPAAPAAPAILPTVETAANQSQPVGAFVWEIGEVDKGTKPSIALTSDGTPYVAYMLEAMPGYVKNAIKNGPGWDISTIKEGYFYGPLDISIGPDDVAHVTYHDHQENSFQPNKGDAVVAVESEGGWDIETIFDSGHDGWDTRITVADDGSVHVSAIDPEEFGGRGVEYYVRDDTGKWKVESIGSGSLTYKYATSVGVDPEGAPHLAFFDQKSNDLALATRSDSGWTIEVVDGDGDTGLFSSLVIDADGRFHDRGRSSWLPTATGSSMCSTARRASCCWGSRSPTRPGRGRSGQMGGRSCSMTAVTAVCQTTGAAPTSCRHRSTPRVGSSSSPRVRPARRLSRRNRSLSPGERRLAARSGSTGIRRMGRCAQST